MTSICDPSKSIHAFPLGSSLSAHEGLRSQNLHMQQIIKNPLVFYGIWNWRYFMDTWMPKRQDWAMAEVHTIKKVVRTHVRCTSLSFADELTSSEQRSDRMVIVSVSRDRLTVISFSRRAKALVHQVDGATFGATWQWKPAHTLGNAWESSAASWVTRCHLRRLASANSRRAGRLRRRSTRDVVVLFFTRPKREQHWPKLEPWSLPAISSCSMTLLQTSHSWLRRMASNRSPVSSSSSSKGLVHDSNKSKELKKEVSRCLTWASW